MKAWYLELDNDPDQGMFVVFSNTRNGARNQADSNDLIYDRWIDIRATRAKRYDDMEHLSEEELHLKLWHDGWRWFDRYDMPDEETASDADFINWHRAAFGGGSHEL